MTTDVPKVHVHMKVSSLEKSRAFYEKFLGTAPVKVKPGYLKFLAPFAPLNLALSEAAPVEAWIMWTKSRAAWEALGGEDPTNSTSRRAGAGCVGPSPS